MMQTSLRKLPKRKTMTGILRRTQVLIVVIKLPKRTMLGISRKGRRRKISPKKMTPKRQIPETNNTPITVLSRIRKLSRMSVKTQKKKKDKNKMSLKWLMSAVLRVRKGAKKRTTTAWI